MEVRLTVHPGQKGAIRLARVYGDRLVCVRYRYDARRKRRLKTVELIIDEQAWVPVPKPGDIVGLRIKWGEVALARRVRESGGQWDKRSKVWRLKYRDAVALGLRDRVAAGI